MKKKTTDMLLYVFGGVTLVALAASIMWRSMEGFSLAWESEQGAQVVQGDPCTARVAEAVEVCGGAYWVVDTLNPLISLALAIEDLGIEAVEQQIILWKQLNVVGYPAP